MPPKRDQATKKAAGGKGAATKAAVKKAGTKGATARAPKPATREQPKRIVKKTQAPPAEENNEEDDVGEALPPSAPQKEPSRRNRKAASPFRQNQKPPTAAPRPTRTKRPTAADEREVEDRRPVKRTRKGKSPVPAAAENTDDEGKGEDQAETSRPKGWYAKAPAPAAAAKTDDEEEGQAGQEDEMRLDDADRSPDCDLEDVDELSRVEFDAIDFTLVRDQTDVTLNFRLQVFEDPEHSDCRLFYRLLIFLTGAGQEEKEAGYIHAYRISRRNNGHRRHAENEAWIRELMPKNISRVPEEISETALCLRAMFTLDGAPAVSKVRDVDIRQSLVDHPLLFIEMIHIRRRYQRQGLLTPVLRHWQRLLQQLPEWFAFLGNIVLVPGKPNNERASAVWADQTEAEVEEALTGAYRKQGFVVWVQRAAVGDVRIRVMGKHLEPIREEDE